MLTGIFLIASVTMGCASTRQRGASGNNAAFDPSAQVEAATSVLRRYEAALNRADVDGIVSLYTPEAVFMAQHRTPAVGRTQIEAAYREIFEMIRLDIAFEIDEVVVVSPTVAYARTRSGGTTTILANNAQISEGNQEIFLLVRDDTNSDWRIGRYIFSTTTPPPTATKTHVPVLEEVRADAIPVDPDVGVGTIALKDGTYVVTDGIWQSAFVVTSRGVIVLDAPESFGTKLHDAIAAVTDQPIKVLVYSHAHKDHIGGSATFAGIPGLKIVALDSVRRFLEQKQDPKRLVPNSTFSEAKTIRLGGKTVALKRHRNYHANEGDLFIYVPESKFLMAVDTLAPAYVPFMNLDLTSNFHEYLKVFDDILGYDFDVFLGGHLTQLGDRADVELTQQYVRDVYETTKRAHDSTDMMAVMARTAQAEGGWDNKYLLFQAFLDQVTAKAVAEVQARWIDKLAGVDVFVDSHIRTALIYVRWDD